MFKQRICVLKFHFFLFLVFILSMSEKLILTKHLHNEYFQTNLIKKMYTSENKQPVFENLQTAVYISALSNNTRRSRRLIALSNPLVQKSGEPIIKKRSARPCNGCHGVAREQEYNNRNTATHVTYYIYVYIHNAHADPSRLLLPALN